MFKSAAKVAGAACVATSVVAFSALVASGAAAGAIVEGFISAKDTMKKLLADEAGKIRSRYEQDCIDGNKKFLEGAGGVLEALPLRKTYGGIY